MTLDIRGSKKTTGISDNQFVVFEELMSNAIDSYLIRRHSSPTAPPLNIRFDIELYQNDLVSLENLGVKVTCTDNGAGMRDEQVKAFVTKDSTFKDDLNIKGIGRCFGSGRVQYFNFFDRLNIISTFENNGEKFKRTLNVDINTKEISEASFESTPAESESIETSIILTGLSDVAVKKHFLTKSLPAEFSAKNIKRHLFIVFLQRFIALREIIGDFNIEISTAVMDLSPENEIINSADFPEKISSEIVPIVCSHQEGEVSAPFSLKISTYQFAENDFPGFMHDVALCANSSVVRSLINEFFKVRKERSKSIDGNFYLILIEGEYLESKVNVRRDNFDIRSNCRNGDLASSGPSMEDIIESIEDYILELLTPTDFDRQNLINETALKFGISSQMLSETRVKVKYGDTASSIATRVLKKYQEDIVDDTSTIFDLKLKLLNLDPRSPDFRESVNVMAWKYTSTIKKMDMANLSQLVVRRSSMLEILSCAVKGLLTIQESGVGINQNEKIIHNIFFPTNKDSNDSIDHDIWILNEEHHYFDHIASDKGLAFIPWNNTEQLFEEDIDQALEELFARNNKENRLKRPDIAIFNQEGSAIIIEFKAPGVELQEHTNDLSQYARLLAAKSKGRIKKFYGYLIGDTIDENRLDSHFTKFPSGKGYFNTVTIKDFNSGLPYGELYAEVLHYHDFIDRAEQRLKIYKAKLGIA